MENEAPKKDLIEAFEEMYRAPTYRSAVAVIVNSDGARLITHGAPTAEIECGLLVMVMNILASRHNELQLLIARAAEIPQGDTN